MGRLSTCQKNCKTIDLRGAQVNELICTQGMQRTWWPEAGTSIVTGPYYKSMSTISSVWCWQCNYPMYAIHGVISKLLQDTVCVTFSKAVSINISMHVAYNAFLVLHRIAINDMKIEKK